MDKHAINLFCKRLMDVSLSASGIIALSPIMIGIAIAIKIDSVGPVLFVQERLTQGGTKFKMLKFRSMSINSEKTGTGLFNYKNDPRVTRVGRFLRSSSLDELPQLFNVLSGAISLVGPRPCVTYELGDYATLNKKYKKRFSVKGGITGLAQIKGRNENSWDEKVTYDNRYVDGFAQQGIWLDIKIIAGTLIKVLKKQEIYEEKSDDTLDDAEAAKRTEEEIIRIAHEQDEDTIETA